MLAFTLEEVRQGDHETPNRVLFRTRESAVRRENESVMHLARSDPLSCDRAEVADILGHDRASLYLGHGEDLVIDPSFELVTLGYRKHVTLMPLSPKAEGADSTK